MIYNGKEVEFPAIMQLSFFKLIELLEQQTQDSDNGVAGYASDLLEDVRKYPELREGISDFTQLKKYEKSIQRFGRILFPEVLTTNEIKLLTPPFYFEPIYTSKRFQKIIEDSGEPFEFTMKDIDENTFYLLCCYFILTSYYGYPVTTGSTQVLEVFNKQTGLTRIYKLLINADLSEFIPTDKAVDISKDDYEELMNNFDDLTLWKKKFPPNSWVMRGTNIVNMVDVTIDQSITSITSNLLVKSADTFEKVQSGIQRMLNNSDLKIGVISLENNKLKPMDKDGITSLLLNEGDSLECNEDMCDYTYELLMNKKESLIITDTEVFHERSNMVFSKRIIESGFQSYIVCPIIYEGEFLGFMELGSKKKYELNKGTLYTLDKVLPILAMAHKRFMTEAQNLVEAIIQQECTTIHPSVKWRFEDEAKRFMEGQLNGQQSIFRDIVFNNLYPLYGQMDIKDSSERRNRAVSTDLIQQIDAVSSVLKAAYEQKQMPVYEELIFRLDAFRDELSEELAAGSEYKIQTFLKEDVYPVFEYLEKEDREMKRLIEEYRSILDEELMTVYEERKKYDTSVNRINQRLASFLDEKQQNAQAMFPHYFERYKTDGIEYNIYIGQSITRDELFNKIHLRNLMIWQLLAMCEMENEFKLMQKELNTSIEVASLILVYNTPISVHFRMDEKQFDVEGAYNARYEIIKKRVDKAHIKGTNERITKPGNIAIVYSQEQDANEYRTYLEFLIAKGYVTEGIQDYELEDLQGVHGLRALRVEVAYNTGLTVDELIQEMEGSTAN